MRKKTIIAITLIGLPTLLYALYVGIVFSRGIDYQILAAITEDSYPMVPKQLAMAYLKYGPISIQAKTSHGQPPISFALAGVGIIDDDNDVYKTIEILIDRGADVNEYNEGLTPLHEAVLFGDIELIKILLSAGANPEAVIVRNNSANGLDAFQFAELLKSKDSETYKPVAEFMQTKTNNRDAAYH